MTIGAKLTKLHKLILSCFEAEPELKTGDIVETVGRARQKVTSGISELVDRFYLERVKYGRYRLLTPENRHLLLRTAITFILHTTVEPYTNFQIADILANPLEEVNTALRKLGESDWCLLHEQDADSGFVVEIDRAPRECFEVVDDTETGPLLAFGSVYGESHIFMLCDLKMLKARGEIQQFINDAYEAFGLSDDASIIYADFSKWTALKFSQRRAVSD